MTFVPCHPPIRDDLTQGHVRVGTKTRSPHKAQACVCACMQEFSVMVDSLRTETSADHKSSWPNGMALPERITIVRSAIGRQTLFINGP